MRPSWEFKYIDLKLVNRGTAALIAQNKNSEEQSSEAVLAAATVVFKWPSKLAEWKPVLLRGQRIPHSEERERWKALLWKKDHIRWVGTNKTSGYCWRNLPRTWLVRSSFIILVLHYYIELEMHISFPKNIFPWTRIPLG